MDFKHWLNTLGVVPVISALRQKALDIQSDTMHSIQRKLPHLTEREMKVLNKHTKSIINQMLRDPILRAKELSAEPNAQESLELFTKIFNIEEAVQQEVQTQYYSVKKEKSASASVGIPLPHAATYRS